MKHSLIFVVVLVGLFILELTPVVHQHFVIPFTAALAKSSSWIVQLFNDQVVAQGIVMRNLENGAAVAIQPGCNGVEAMICLTAGVLAFPASWRYKLFGLGVGYLAIQLLNIVRIISLFYLLQWNVKMFEWAHLYLWQALIILDAFFVFVLWVRYMPEAESRLS